MGIEEWIPLLLFLVALGFLAWAYVKPPTTSAQHGIIRTMCATLVGFATAYFAGTAEFEFLQNLPAGGRIAFSGVMGFAAFGLVWVQFPAFELPKPDDSLSISFDEDESFESAARSVAQSEGRAIDLDQLTTEERGASLRRTELSTRNAEEALVQLRLQSKTPIRPYTVRLQGGAFLLVPNA